MSRAARHARWRGPPGDRCPEHRHPPSPVNLSTVPAVAAPTAVNRSSSPAMISRESFRPDSLGVSMEWTTSANRTVTCLYSAERVAGQSLRRTCCRTMVRRQLRAWAEHDGRSWSTPPSGSTSIWCHRWSTLSVLSSAISRSGPSDPMARRLAGLTSTAWNASGSGRGSVQAEVLVGDVRDRFSAVAADLRLYIVCRCHHRGSIVCECRRGHHCRRFSPCCTCRFVPASAGFG